MFVEAIIRKCLIEVLILQCTAARAWRQPHILQQHIFDIKEHVGVIASSVNGFLDAACRIAIDVINPKNEGTNFILFNFFKLKFNL